MSECKCLNNGSPAYSNACKPKETGAAVPVSTTENIIARTLANTPQNEARIRGNLPKRRYPCTVCGQETEWPDICTPCLEARARRQERARDLSRLLKVNRVQRVEDLPPAVLAEHQRRHARRCA